MSERRRAQLPEDEEGKQLALPLGAARRRAIVDLTQPDDGPAATVDLRVSAGVAATIVADRVSARRALETALKPCVDIGDLLDKCEHLCGYTDWSRNRPESDGYWELKQRSAKTPDGSLWWYSAALNKWHRGVSVQDSRQAGFVDHAVLMASHEWRGLRKPWPYGYDYELRRAPFAVDLPAALPATQAVTLTGEKIEVHQQGLSRVDLNPRRRRVQM
jgi:hypothetical protein